MANLMPAWQLVRVYGTWTHPDQSPGASEGDWARSEGTYSVIYPGRITNMTDDNMWAGGGVYETGTLSTEEGEQSLDIMIPATDDPDIEQVGFKATISVTVNGVKEVYVIDVPLADRPVENGGTGAGVNLRTIALADNIGPRTALYGVGTPGGLAKLSSDGTAVVDANGNPIVGGGEGGVAGVASVNGRIGAVTLAKSDVGLGNVDNTADSAKPVSTATQTALNAKAPLASPALTGTPTAPTASAGTETTQIATTAFVAQAINNIPDDGSGTVSEWGDIDGDLANQTDLAAVLDTLARQVIVTTGTEARPAGAFCIWYDQREDAETPPTNIGANDIWITSGTTGGGEGGGTDTTPPSTPTGLAASSITANSFTVTWSASTDNVGVTGYRVYVDGAAYATPTSTSQVIAGRTADTAYDITVQARDAAGNWSAESSVLEVTTSSTPTETYSVHTTPPALTPSEYTDGSSTQWVGYGFYRSGASLTVVGARLWIPETATAMLSDTIVSFRVYTGDWNGSSTLPTGTAAATATYSGPITAGTWVEANLSAPVTVNAVNSGSGGADALWVVYQVGDGSNYVAGVTATGTTGGPNNTYMAEGDFYGPVFTTNGGSSWAAGSQWYGIDIKATL